MLTFIEMFANARNTCLRVNVCVQIYHLPIESGMPTSKQLVRCACNEDYKRAAATACNPDNLTGPI